MEPTEFEAWLQQGGQTAAAQAQALAAGPNPEVGKQLMVDKGCGACHTIAGVQGLGGAVGPQLTHIATDAATMEPGKSAEDYIRESILEPTAFTVPGFPAGVMPKIPLTDDELNSIVAYLLTLK
jgi:mono/diheme cytochrome c family protein